MRASLWRTLADMAEPITAAVRAEIGEAAAHQLYRAGLRTVAGLRVSARAGAGGWLRGGHVATSAPRARRSASARLAALRSTSSRSASPAMGHGCPSDGGACRTR